MLCRLTIRDFVLVDRLELEFQQGFGTLTGETGAGKSILVDAWHSPWASAPTQASFAPAASVRK
jgi:DNA repair ATPase RecN